MDTKGKRRVQPCYENFHPNSDWNVEPGNYTLRVFLPGFKKEEFIVQIDHQGKLTVKGKKQLEENKFMALDQTYNVPKDSDHDKITGKFDHECLTLVIPRKISQDQKKTSSSSDDQQQQQQQQQKQEQNLIPADHDGLKGDHDDHEKKKKKKDEEEVIKSSEKYCESSKVCLLEHGVVDCLLDRMNRNRKVIAVAFVAFSVGFYVSHKLKTAGK
ncbi:Small heat shock protein HSP20 protein [Dioscorea alata]|uniref:Small heat shock protein HSP20 protein n=1 Tax=Dioscorea alata TaxID=55571 RepID=A0ACB7WF56_DIOAL|nr:Small heat shock protein HSP20 protein [Dioscorea alata]